jgi:hypothetical protein
MAQLGTGAVAWADLNGSLRAVMETDEISAILDAARHACAEAREIARAATVESGDGARHAAVLARLIELTEWLLDEREAFAGRLRRSSTPRPASPVGQRVLPPQDVSASAPDSTP